MVEQHPIAAGEESFSSKLKNYFREYGGAPRSPATSKKRDCGAMPAVMQEFLLHETNGEHMHERKFCSNNRSIQRLPGFRRS